MIRFSHFVGTMVAAVVISANADTSPGDVRYSVTKDESKANIKRTVEVVLDQRVDQQTLESLAQKIKDSKPGSYQRTFIGWRIKCEESGAYWVKTDYLPNLSVQFLGSTLAQYNQLQSPGTTVEGEVFGSWVGTWGADYKMVGYRKAGKTFIRSTYTDGASGTTELVEKTISGRSALVDVEGSDFDEYYSVNARGDLEFWGEGGNYYTAKAIH
ncbi:MULTISPECIES: hypothetical protein [Pseudomonas syringae group]|uniref:Uncharacterized protein n=1 Tax=Pseudomonas asturiensis TaxID=1190415 RepID=A0ABX6HEA3_9PSED|nr:MULTISPECIES: hypothetical protein [Pseudomonas syringae group]QHF03875.1 hypothetical protein N015_16225 [Pseudomonas asturiensis]QXG39133.1 hypothetical protein KTT55_17300 [Pseudomonas viridiflava]